MLGPVPDGKPIWYQKHMTHHMVDGFGREWIESLRQRLPDPRAGGGARLLSSRRATISRSPRSACRRRSSCSSAPATGSAIRRRWSRARTCSPIPKACCAALCAACGVAFDPAMLTWAAGPPPDRRRLGAGLVRRGRALDRLRAAAPGAWLRRPARRAEAARREGAAALRHAGGAQTEGRRGLTLQPRRDLLGDRQRGGEAGAFDAEQIDEPRHAVRLGPVDAEIGGGIVRTADLRPHPRIGRRQRAVRQARPVAADRLREVARRGRGRRRSRGARPIRRRARSAPGRRGRRSDARRGHAPAARDRSAAGTARVRASAK